MYIFLIVLIIIASILLVLAVLAQNPKGGMAANFGASNQVMGVRQTADFLDVRHGHSLLPSWCSASSLPLPCLPTEGIPWVPATKCSSR